MKIRCIVLYVMPYSIPDERTGEINEGISCTYIPTDDLSSVLGENGAMGIKTCKQSFSVDLIDKFKTAPAI